MANNVYNLPVVGRVKRLPHINNPQTGIRNQMAHFLIVFAVFVVPVLLHGPARINPEVTNWNDRWQVDDRSRETLRILTLNVAHGRAAGRHQALRSRNTINGNLAAVADVLARERAEIVALQEADGPSWWSGQFNHVEAIAEEAKYSSFFRGEHVKGMGLNYGTALLSTSKLADATSITFSPSPPTLSKGFVSALVGWPGDANYQVTVVSVHFDFSRKSVRKRQAQAMINELKDAKRPLVIVGDFNCDWSAADDALKVLATGLDLQAYEPDTKTPLTFPKMKRRFDWILISPELEFESHETLAHTVSDHRAVVAEVRRKD